jgi:hypothetical protein
MKKVFFAAFAAILFLQCGDDSINNPQPDNKVVGTWIFSLTYNADTTFYIVLDYYSTSSYRINVNINHVDSMHREVGTYQVISDTVTKQDTVWMDRIICRQINLSTHSFDSIDCGNPRAGIKVNISQNSDNKTQWVIPLGDFVKYLPPGIIPEGIPLPLGGFIKQ